MALPRGVDGLRPTSALVRSAIFDRIGAAIEGARVLDLFAGSGALAIEALSRGASSAVLVDLDPRVVRHLRAQLQALGLANETDVARAEAVGFLARRPAQMYDLVLVDPPFARPDVFAPVAAALCEGWLAPGALVVCERERVRGKSPMVSWPAALVLENSRTYGQVDVDFLRHAGSEP
jgi:16S rRNA (guanine966-N2)-methyltransferase